ncbi:hypothetical protein BT63DRAFT_170301 [Microthyrium microscopicum]|uniref:Uncharacterized protein n=1 Tax=Microthyrium microscopicum TaxID=703497 RepID=A0A6A6UNU7_9PEZI|nr:hypothetical protein BT63DRAFT_170301 [Microthyrium microscopicum]
MLVLPVLRVSLSVMTPVLHRLIFHTTLFSALASYSVDITLQSTILPLRVQFFCEALCRRPKVSIFTNTQGSVILFRWTSQESMFSKNSQAPDFCSAILSKE